MKYRHEWKYEINHMDRLILRQRLRAIASQDENTINGGYDIRSLYFDNLYDKALREKIDGVNQREKFRLRYYNGDTSMIRLEKKSKINGLCNKQSAVISENEVQMILDGEYDFLKESGKLLLQEFYAKIKSQGLRPMVIVDYHREPYVYGPGNVRITIDSDMRTSRRVKGFLDWNTNMLPIKNSPTLLEVKWDEFLPDVIKEAVDLGNRRVGAFSKYAASRIYG